MGEDQYEALEARGLDPDQAAKRGWHACAGPSEGVWVGIPYLDNGKRVGCKRRSITGEKRFYSDKGSMQILWNVDCLRDVSLKHLPIIITEGEMDAEAAIEAGFPRTVSVPGGAPLEEDPDGAGARWRYLEHAQELLDGVREIIVAVDSDGPGKNLAKALVTRLGRHRCREVTYPIGKDLGDVLKLLGPGGVRDVLTNATWVRAPGLYRASELPEGKRPIPMTIGIVGMDEHYRMRRGDLAVITGAPGHGKSSFINNVACNMAHFQQLRTCFASFEQHPTLDHRRALRSYHARKREVDMLPDERAQADDWIDERFSFIWPGPSDSCTLSWVVERFATAAIQHKADIMVLDPWNSVDTSDRPRDWTQTEYVHHALQLLKKFAREYDIHMIVAAHPAKMLRGKDGKVPAPGLYDIADSAAWANRCDIGIVIHRPEMMATNDTQIAVVKSRFFSQIGKPGMVTGIWDETQTRYTITDDGAGMRAN